MTIVCIASGLFDSKFILQGKGTGSGHRTLLYGNAILLRHQNSDMVSVITILDVRRIFWSKIFAKAKSQVSVYFLIMFV